MTRKKLTDDQLNMLKLVKRSQVKANDEWAPVSKCCWHLLDKFDAELVEAKNLEDDEMLGGYVRLTPEGEILIKWLYERKS